MSAPAIDPDQIVAGARRLPRGQSAELFDRLVADTADPPDPEIGQAWKIETCRRIAEIETGGEPGVPGGEALAELRRVAGR
jgi:hypothetical protein